ncbi:hypothetical protein PaG_05130 [Moesziomyces aphidis]|jgi:adenylate kinase family enzyme|uniref:P-loop containing nucleoside triphosphate hydrolase protein n=1 Tax=Moesziomyces aphidis TaxID=84754 RepID=W3VHX0_MOEAP|nr:hypothetical protein PaG_05130 [Moesziomyces aphidis]
MLNRSFSTSAARACVLGDQRVASRVPRLATKPLSAAAYTSAGVHGHARVQSHANASETYASRRSVSEAFSLLAGSKVSAHTGLRGRHASTWAKASPAHVRTLTTTSARNDLKQDAKDKLVEEGKKFAREKVDEKLSGEEVKQQAKNASSSLSKILFGALAVAGAAYMIMGGTAHAEEAPKSKDQGESGPRYSKDKVSLLCLVGPSLSGKSTQAKRLLKRFSSEIDDIVQPKSLDDLNAILSSRTKGNKRVSLILDNFPSTLEDAQRIEAEIVPIFCFSFYDLPLKDFELRLPKSLSEEDRQKRIDEFNKYSKRLEPLIHKYRDQGNIYEISADWDSADEVWEQVEAKTEQILELRERGDL